MRFQRSSGTLVHPTSFPAEYGIGDLGSEARRFIDFLVETKQSVWQVLPLGPTGYGNSPYASYSAFAGNYYLISPDILVEKELLKRAEADDKKMPVTTQVNYEKAFAQKREILNLAAQRFFEKADKAQMEQYEKFVEDNAYWINDYCLFMAALETNDLKPWNQWDNGIAHRKTKALNTFEEENSERIRFHYWSQYEFFSQWYALKKYANDKNIRVVGDIPIFVDHNSADVWAQPKYFEVDAEGNRQLVAGVPPDYFSETGQLWGNPLYKWAELEKDGYAWWLERFKQMFEMYDAIRVDHFRGFDAYWEVKADEKTAIKGRWVKGPGSKLFDTIKDKLGELPIIAEDLGVITKEVVALREKYNFPGMKILQFAFTDNSGNNFLPHNYSQNCVTYTGTHDNDTTLGWYNSATDHEKHFARKYTRSSGDQMNWELIRLGLFSVADQAIIPLQDYMNLGTEHRMNYPGTTEGNWMWRYTPEMLEKVDKQRIQDMIEMSNRDPNAGYEDSNLEEIEAEEAAS